MKNKLVICNPTVHHSGTKFTSRELFSSFETVPLMHWESVQDRNSNVLLQGHTVNQHWKPWVRALTTYPIVLFTLRHPFRVWESFQRRNKRDFGLYSNLWDNLIQLYYNRMYWGPQEHIFFLHIDDFDLRNEQVKYLNTELDLKLETTWPINEHLGCKENTHAVALDDIRGTDRIPHRYIDFYAQTS